MMFVLVGIRLPHVHHAGVEACVHHQTKLWWQYLCVAAQATFEKIIIVVADKYHTRPCIWAGCWAETACEAYTSEHYLIVQLYVTGAQILLAYLLLLP